MENKGKIESHRSKGTELNIFIRFNLHMSLVGISIVATLVIVTGAAAEVKGKSISA